MRWPTVVLCLVQGGYMLLDGGRALVVGTYVTPGSGECAGQLGPWARLVSLVGVDPESKGMKVAFVLLGLWWLILGLDVATGSSWALPLGAGLAVGTLWYLVPGTVLSVLVLVLLSTPQLRDALDRG